MDKYSISRFYDDLVEDIFQFLKFDEKLIYECVCKQWKKSIYVRQTVLAINGNYDKNYNKFNTLNKLLIKTKVENLINRLNIINKTGFKSILKKCQFIKKLVIIGCECDNEVLEIIANNCQFLEDIECEMLSVNENSLLNFGRKCGQKLKKLRFIYFTIDYSVMKKFLEFCPNLEEVNCDIFAAIVDERNCFLPKLRNVRFRVRAEDQNNFVTFAEKFSKHKTLESLRIYGENKCYEMAFKQISRIDSIGLLAIDLCNAINCDLLLPNFLLIAINCKNIEVLEISSWNFISVNFFKSLSNFFKLNKLIINSRIKFDNNLTISELKTCENLSHLVMNGIKINEIFFTDIDLYLPNLKFVKLTLLSKSIVTDYLLLSLAKLKNLVKFSLSFNSNQNIESSTKIVNNNITDNGLCDLINNCPNVSKIELKNFFPTNLTNKTINAFIVKAINNKKMNFSLKLVNKNEDYSTFEKNLTIEKKMLPKNLKIII